MVDAPANPFLRFLHRVAGKVDGPDGFLLARFTEHRDEAAFAALVQRHGPLVWGVCRRVLGGGPDAEDCFQATFFVLVRKARYLSRPDLLGNWLYAVAYRTALRTRANSTRRPDAPLTERSANDPAGEAYRNELRRILDAELSRLPERYRMPVVLCYLEGQTHQEAARWLGCPRKTVTTRLSRACNLLRSRLARRGLALSISGIVAGLMHKSAGAAVAATAAVATTGAAVASKPASAAAAPAVSRPAPKLTKRALRALRSNRVRWAAAGLVALLGLATAAADPASCRALADKSVAVAKNLATAVSPEAVAKAVAEHRKAQAASDAAKRAKAIAFTSADDEDPVTGRRAGSGSGKPGRTGRPPATDIHAIQPVTTVGGHLAEEADQDSTD
jgi:RNA polymerase sigma factor (sigma-70 family)